VHYGIHSLVLPCVCLRLRKASLLNVDVPASGISTAVSDDIEAIDQKPATKV